LKRVRPETVNYAKRAKRIDVKKLKDTMWKELEEVALPVKKVSGRIFSLGSSSSCFLH
jgi:condensin complex subunit 2